MFGFNASAKGGKTDVNLGNIKWDWLEKLAEFDERYNRINRYGPFGGWEYDPETKSQRFVATSPGMQAAQERMDRRLAGEGFDAYEPPAQVSSITDALMASRMGRMGILNDETAPNLAQENYGPRFGHRQGGGWQNARDGEVYQIPPPEGAAPPEQAGPPPDQVPPPPQQGQPPPNRPYPPTGPENPFWRPPYKGVGRPPYNIP
jgi:hypothetical protein